jgi:hypothetical protein
MPPFEWTHQNVVGPQIGLPNPPIAIFAYIAGSLQLELGKSDSGVEIGQHHPSGIEPVDTSKGTTASIENDVGDISMPRKGKSL